MLTQFVAAFDDTVIKRYDKNNNARQNVEVRYVFAPKQRVMYDIVNKAQNLTLPVVAIDLTSITYDNDRVFNKINNLYNYTNSTDSTEIRMPVPINLEINFSIIARYMQDMEQIVSNFAPYSNPYIVIAWEEPSETGDSVEIRTEVEWSQSIALNQPTDLTYTDKFRVVADTTFTIKGWLFRDKNTASAPIYFIEQNFINSTANYNLTQPLTSLDYENFFNSLTAECDVETFILSAIPSITNIYHTTTGTVLDVVNPITLNKHMSAYNMYNYNILGTNFLKTDLILLSANNTSLTNNLTAIDTTYTGPVSGFVVDPNNYKILSDEVLTINIPYLSGSGDFDIIVKNPAGWGSSNSISGLYFIAE
jgi:hypothetical protein